MPGARPAGLPVGKLPQELLARMLASIPIDDPRVILGPGVGLDCAVVDAGDRLLVCKTDPITFASDQIGYYLVQVNANDIATTGAIARWLLVTLLLPERSTTNDLAESIMSQVGAACRDLGIVVIGGHTEITAGIDRPIAVGTMLGEVSREALVTPRGARAGDHVLLTKGVPIEATSLLARELPHRLHAVLSPAELREAQEYLFRPGIGVTRDARVALGAGPVTAMHDPTEGGIVTALWELARASHTTLRIEAERITVPPLAERVCRTFGVDPMCSIASGALLIVVPPDAAAGTALALAAAGIACCDIGTVAEGPPRVERTTSDGPVTWGEPVADAIGAVFAGATDPPA